MTTLRFLFHPILALVVLLLHTDQGFGQTYPFKDYTIADGLSGSTVECIYQDAEGYFWIGTTAGVDIYDGVSFKHFLSEPIGHHSILQLNGGEVWIASEGKGIAVCSLGREQIRRVRKQDGMLPSDSVYVLFQDRDANVWIGTAQGLVVLNPDGNFQVFDQRHGLPHRWINAIAQPADGTMWIATNGGLFRCEYSNRGLVQKRSYTKISALALAPTRQGGILAGTAEGGARGQGLLLRVDSLGRVDTLLSSRRTGGVLKILSIFEDGEGTIWVAASLGLYVLRNSRVEFVGRERGLSSSYVNAVSRDREGSMWFGTEGGLTRLPPRLFRHYRLPGEETSQILRFGRSVHDGSVWFGGYGKLVRKSSLGEFIALQPEKIGWNTHAIAEDKAGTVWIGTHDVGLKQFKDGKLTQANIDGFSRTTSIGAIHIDQLGTMWLGANDTLYEVRHQKVVKKYGKAAGIPRDYIQAVVRDSSGAVWIGTDGSGVGRLIDGSVRMFTTANGLPSNVINQLYLDQQSVLWCATYLGIRVFDGERFKAPELPGVDLEGIMTYSIFQDDRNHYWFFTPTGLYEWRDTLIAHYDSRDGLPADRVYCTFQDRDRNLWVGTVNGPAFLPFPELRSAIPTPQVRLSRLIEGNTSVSVMPQEYSHDRNFITLRFHAMAFLDEHLMEFQWRMTGADIDWRSEPGQRIARYPLLPPEKYEFQVRARNRNGAWSTPARYPFTILPAYWQTWWFRGMILLIVAAGLLAFYRYRVGRLLEMERLRLRIAGDLHDEIGSYLGGITLESQLIQLKGDVSTEIKGRLGKITTMAQQTAEAMRDMVWLINPEHDTLGTVILKMRDIASQLLQGRTVNFLGPGNIEEEILPLEFKRQVFLIYKEAVHNIAKHSSATTVDIRIDRTDSQLVLAVKDNGQGYDEKTVKNGNGVRNIRDRAAKIGANLFVSTSPGKGTSIEFSAKIPRTRYGKS